VHGRPYFYSGRNAAKDDATRFSRRMPMSDAYSIRSSSVPWIVTVSLAIQLAGNLFKLFARFARGHQRGRSEQFLAQS